MVPQLAQSLHSTLPNILFPCLRDRPSRHTAHNHACHFPVIAQSRRFVRCRSTSHLVDWEHSSIRVHVTASASKVVSNRRTESDLESPDNHRGSVWCGRCGNGPLPGTRGRGTETSDDETCWNAAPSYALRTAPPHATSTTRHPRVSRPIPSQVIGSG
jgi:hypothetical protein